MAQPYIAPKLCIAMLYYRPSQFKLLDLHFTSSSWLSLEATPSSAVDSS